MFIFFYFFQILSTASDCGYVMPAKRIGEYFSTPSNPNWNVCMKVRETNSNKITQIKLYPSLVDDRQILQLKNFRFDPTKTYKLSFVVNAIKSQEIDFITPQNYYPYFGLILSMDEGVVSGVLAGNYSTRLKDFLTSTLTGNIVDIKIVLSFNGTDKENRILRSVFGMDINNLQKSETLKKRYEAEVVF